MQNYNNENKRKFISEILTQMKKEEYAFNFNEIKSKESKEIQKNISYYFSKRRKLITIIKDIHNYLNFNKDTFYSAVYYMDIVSNKLIEESFENFETYDFKNLAISCLILSSKFTDNDPNIPNVKLYLYDKNNKNNQNILKEKIDNLKEFEIKCLNKLSYKLNYSNVFSFLKMFYCYGFIFKIDFEIFKKITKENVNDNAINTNEAEDFLLEKFMPFVEFAYKKCDEIIYIITLEEIFFIENFNNNDNDNNITKEFNSFKIACGVIYYCREIFYDKIKDESLIENEKENEKEKENKLHNNQISEIWGNLLQDLYAIKFSDFEKEYKLIKE